MPYRRTGSDLRFQFRLGIASRKRNFCSGVILVSQLALTFAGSVRVY